MNRTKRLRGPCQHCGGPIEYPAEMIGTTAQCPHCRRVTELQLAVPAQEPGVPKRIIVWTLVAVLILLGGLAGALIALKKTESFVRDRKAPAAQPATNATPSP